MSERKTVSEDELREVVLQTYLDFHTAQVKKGTVPRPDNHVLGRWGRFLEYFGAIEVAFLLAALVLLLVFMVTRLVAHIDVARYFPY